MSDIKLGNNTLTGITKVNIPLADGSGNATFNEGWEPPYITIICRSDYAQSDGLDFTLTCNNITKTRAELRSYTETKGHCLIVTNDYPSRSRYYLTASDILALYGVDITASYKTFTLTAGSQTSVDQELYYYADNPMRSGSISFTQLLPNASASASVGNSSAPYIAYTLMIQCQYTD